MGTLTIKVSSGNLESYEALFLQLPDPTTAPAVERLELVFGDVTQVLPSAYGLLAAYVTRTRDRAKRPLVTRRFGANPQSAKLERAMDAIGFIAAVLGEKPPPAKAGSGVIPLIAIEKETEPYQVANRVLETLLALTQPTRDAKESLFVLITELVENIQLHAAADGASFLCGQLSAQKRKLELCLVDAGMGIRPSLEGGKDRDAVRRIQSGTSALRLALEAGRTSKGQGNTGFGLAVAVAATAVNKGVFRLTSGDETLLFSREGEKHRTHARWFGTVVNLLFNLDKVGALSEAYKELPLSLGEEERFLPGAERLRSPTETVVALKTDSPYLGSREAAAQARAELLATVRTGRLAVADLDGVLTIAPGYADACFGELLDSLGAEQFRATIGVRNANETVRLLLEAVLGQRLRPRDFAAPSPPPAARAASARAASARAKKPAVAAAAVASEALPGATTGGDDDDERAAASDDEE